MPNNPHERYNDLKNEAHALIAQLSDLLGEHLVVTRNCRNWAHVGDLGHVVDGLHDLVDFLRD